MYNLWSNHGEVKFAFYNKTNMDIFINMNQTSLIINGQSHNYYKNKTQSYKVINKNSINPILILTCNKAKDFPKTKYNVETYEQSSTPLTIVNRIAYGFDKENVSENYINNTFWVNSITNYSKKSATDNIKHKSCYSIFYTNYEEFVIGSPNKFYVTYKKSDYSVINDDMY